MYLHLQQMKILFIKHTQLYHILFWMVTGLRYLPITISYGVQS